MDIDILLPSYQNLGINLGLERIHQLLADLNHPQSQVPIIHVAGTNGKGSVCAYLGEILTVAGYRVGRYTSPHLVNWTERIWVSGEYITTPELISLLDRINSLIQPDKPTPTQFECLTAAAWLYFAQKQVDVAIMEVGLGGRLDATNVIDNPLVTVITSISRDHWQQLGNTLADIATEKAGILKPHRPAIVGQLPLEAARVVQSTLDRLDCPHHWVKTGAKILKEFPTGERQVIYNDITYTLPLCGDIQLLNSALAISVIQSLRSQGWKITDQDIQKGIAQTQWLGRLQWTTYQGQKLLIDGAHNSDAAIALRRYVERFNQPISWVIGMLSTKEHDQIFQALLRPGDRLYLVPVPDNYSSSPTELAQLAIKINADLDFVGTYEDLTAGLNAAFNQEKAIVVLCGSLYLLGDFLRIN